MNHTVANRKDILLLLMYSPGVGESVNEPISGRTRFVKMLFVFREEQFKNFKKGITLDIDAFYNFVEWDYGPFCREVYDDLDFFILRGFIDASRGSDADPLPESAAEWAEWQARAGLDLDDGGVDEYEEETFSLTPQGEEWTRPLYESLTDAQRSLLKAFKKRFARAPLRAILRYVYEKYPKWTQKSKIKNQILSNG
jgi:hypothetical protein